jgi:capsular polysaccharide biosynthesis protein
MEPLRLIAVIRRNLLRIAILAVIVGVAVGIGSSYLPRTYQASTKLLVAGKMLGDPPLIDEISAASRMAQTLAELATTRPLLSAALASAGDATDPATFKDQLNVTAAPDSLFIVVTVRAADPAASANLANAVASQLIAQAPPLLGWPATATSPVSTVETAAPPAVSTAPRSLLYGVLAGVAVAIVALALAVLLDAQRTPVRPGPSWPDRPSVPEATARSRRA